MYMYVYCTVRWFHEIYGIIHLIMILITDTFVFDFSSIKMITKLYILMLEITSCITQKIFES